MVLPKKHMFLGKTGVTRGASVLSRSEGPLRRSLAKTRLPADRAPGVACACTTVFSSLLFPGRGPVSSALPRAFEFRKEQPDFGGAGIWGNLQGALELSLGAHLISQLLVRQAEVVTDISVLGVLLLRLL